MELKEYLKLLTRKKETIALLVVVVLIFGAIFTVLQPFRYSAVSKILIVQNRGPVDPYVITKTNEYVTKVLTNVIASDYFFKEVMNSGYNIETSYFSEDTAVRKEKWTKTVTALATSDAGVIIIKVLHRDKNQAAQIAEAVNYLIKTKSGEYHGIGSVIEIKVLDPPAVSQWPVEPKIIFNLVLSLVLGIILALVYIYFFPEEKYDLKFWPFTSGKEKINKREKDHWMSAGEVLEKKKEDYNLVNFNQALKNAMPEKVFEEPKEELEELEVEDEFADERLTYDDFLKKADIKNIMG